MNPRNIIAVVLVVLGVVVLAYSGLSFTTTSKPVEVLGLQVATTKSHYVPPTAGALALIGGIVLLLARPRKT